MTTYELFPVLVKEYDIDHEIDIDSYEYFHSNPSVMQSTNFFDRELEQKILKCIYDFNSTIGNVEREFFCTEMWINKFELTGSIHPHFHSNSMFSCVYYYSLDNNMSGNTVFENPFNYTRDIIQTARSNPRCYNADTFTIPAREGKLLIFPSWLKHFSQQNSSQNTRVTVSANFLPKILGVETDLNYCKIKE